MNLEINVIGLKEIQDTLKKLSPIIQRRVVRTAVTAGARVLAKEAKARVPVDSGLLKKSLTARNRKSKPGLERASVAFTKSKDIQDGKIKIVAPSRRAHLTEFGTGDRTQKKNGKSVGSSPAKPFLRPALAAAGSAAIVAFTEKAAANLAKEAGRFAAGKLDAKGRVKR